MNKTDDQKLNDLCDSANAGSLKAWIENYIVGEIDAVKRGEIAALKTEQEAALQAEKDKTAASEAAAALALSDAQAAASAEAARLQAAADAKAAELAQVKADAIAFRETIKAIVSDEATPTDPAVLEAISQKEAEEARPAREKAIAAATQKRDAAQAELDALTA